MGVPRFFRWVSERYPQILQKIIDSTPPEYDMNGIIHACSQEFANSLIEFSEEELIRKVCNYVDRLFHTIRPTKLFYMAIDGVAPRSKINQQRQRRFLSVHRDEKLKQQLIADGKPVPEVIFNRTAITPGTQFMYNLSESLQFYIKKKISEDLSWREVQVIFSGPENPGEGEHKIIDFIRRNKADPEWDPNQSHCLYGLDADLILLGLITHEPNFSILREEISFKPTKRQLDFQLLHISLLREYLELELRNDELEFGYDLERIIDDFILIMIFFGNDFLPHLPMLEISKGGLNSVFELYREALPKLGGYLTDGSIIDLDRLQQFFVHIQKFERKQQNLLLGNSEDEENEEVEKEVGELVEDSILEHDGLEEDARKEFERLAFERIKGHFNMEELDGEEQEVESTEDSYYRQHFKDFPSGSKQEMQQFKDQVVLSYVEGLVWVLNYYHNGCISWTWFYPFYYAPLASDFKDISSLDINFEGGTPITPFQQLLSVLPPQSVDLIPTNYQKLMLDPSSPIIDFYPVTFEIDTKDPHYFDGIAELGFIDHQRLLDATHQIKKDLAAKGQEVFSEEEKQRNSIKNSVIIYHDPDMEPTHVKSPNSKIFKDIEFSTATTEDIVLPTFENALKPFRYCEEVLIGTESPYGFPTLKSLDFTWKYQNSVIDIWGMMSRKDSIIVIPPNASKENSETIDDFLNLKSKIGKQCYVGWPYHQEAKILYFSNSNQKLFSQGTVDNTTSQKITFLEHVKRTKLQLLRKGINIYYDDNDNSNNNNNSNNSNNNNSKDSVNYSKLGYEDSNLILVHVNKLVGVTTLSGGSTKKRYSDEEDVYPLELLVDYDRVAQDSRFVEVGEQSFETRFPVGKQVLCTKKEYYGCIGTVFNHYDNQLHLELRVPTKKIDMNYGHERAKNESSYYSIQEVAKQCSTTVAAISQLTAGLFILKPMVDIGLNLKFTGRQQQVLGYCRGFEVGSTGHRIWEFSKDALNLIQEYFNKFPKIHQVLQLFSSGPKNSKAIDISPIFESKEEKSQFLSKVEEFIESSGIRKKRIVPCGTSLLDKSEISNIEQHYGEISSNTKYKIVEIHCTADQVVEPASYESVISLERHHQMKSFQNKSDNEIKSPTLKSYSFQKFANTGKFSLGDRVVTILDKGNIPFGTFGTVVSIQDQKVDVVFDKECFSGNNLEGLCSEKRGVCISKLRLFNLSQPPPLKPLPTNFYDIDPSEYWEKLQVNNSNNNNNNNNSIDNNSNNNNNKKQFNQNGFNNNNNQAQQTDQPKPLNWQQMQLLSNLTNPQANQQQQQQQQQSQPHQQQKNLHPMANTSNNTNYQMKRKPQYIKSNFDEKEYDNMAKDYPKLNYDFYYDQNDQRKQPPVYTQQYHYNQKKQQDQSQQAQQIQQQKPQKTQKKLKQKKGEDQQTTEQPAQPAQPVDPKMIRNQNRLNLIYQSIESENGADNDNNNSSGSNSNGINNNNNSSPSTNPSTMLLLNEMFKGGSNNNNSSINNNNNNNNNNNDSFDDLPPPPPHPHMVPSYYPYPQPHIGYPPIMGYPHQPHPHMGYPHQPFQSYHQPFNTEDNQQQIDSQQPQPHYQKKKNHKYNNGNNNNNGNNQQQQHYNKYPKQYQNKNHQHPNQHPNQYPNQSSTKQKSKPQFIPKLPKSQDNQPKQESTQPQN